MGRMVIASVQANGPRARHIPLSVSVLQKGVPMIMIWQTASIYFQGLLDRNSQLLKFGFVALE